MMASRVTARLCGAALVVMSVSALTARPASAQEIERTLVGIRLGSKSNTVLAKYGNPNEVVIGDVGLRTAGVVAGGGQPGGVQPGPDGEGLPGAPGSPGYPTNMGGGVGAFGMPKSMGGGGGALSAAPMSASPGGGGGTPPMSAGPTPMGGPPSGFPGAPGGGFPGGGAPYGAGGGMPTDGEPGSPGTGAAIGGFGQTYSTLAREQEVTWIYNRKVNNNLVSYEFLIGPSGNVEQIRVTGYSGGGARTKRGIGLGSTYKDVVKVYGYPEEHAQVGRVLVTSYRKSAHVQFQYLSQSGQANPIYGGNKVIGITIATVE